MVRKDKLPGCTLTASQFLQARYPRICEPCVVCELRRVSHPLKSKQPVGAVRVLAYVSMDLCSLTGVADAVMRYIKTHTDRATRYAIVVPLALKSDAATAARRAIFRCETQIGLKLHHVRHDRGRQCMLRSLSQFFDERDIQIEPTPSYSP